MPQRSQAGCGGGQGSPGCTSELPLILNPVSLWSREELDLRCCFCELCGAAKFPFECGTQVTRGILKGLDEFYLHPHHTCTRSDTGNSLSPARMAATGTLLASSSISSSQCFRTRCVGWRTLGSDLSSSSVCTVPSPRSCSADGSPSQHPVQIIMRRAW